MQRIVSFVKNVAAMWDLTSQTSWGNDWMFFRYGVANERG